MIILTLNCRSQTIHYHLFDYPNPIPLTQGYVEGIGTHSTNCILNGSPLLLEDHHAALDYILKSLCHPEFGVLDSLAQIRGVGHRVVHGGEAYSHSVKIDVEVLHNIRKVERMAPKYNIPSRETIIAAMELLPDIDHVAIFDTAFHHTMPAQAYMYPLPYEWYEKYRVRRYGFHGSSHLYLARRAAAHLGKPVEECNLITIHLDLGVSLCAIRNGRSVDTSTGMTPVEGTAQERRCGNIDPGIPGFLMDWEELSPQQIEEVLNEKSGLMGLTGGDCTTRQEVLLKAAQNDPRAQFAAQIEAYRLRKFIGEYLCVLGQCDAIVFSSGQGNIESDVRRRVLEGMDWFNIHLDAKKNDQPRCIHSEIKISRPDSAIALFVIPTDEARVFCEDTAQIVKGTFDSAHNISYTFDNL